MARTLLIVDDIQSNREILKNILRTEYEIAEASSGDDALRFLLENHDSISAVLLDVDMPKMNGLEVLQKIRSNALLASLPVIMIADNKSDDNRIKALSCGTNDYVMSPYNLDVSTRFIPTTGS